MKRLRRILPLLLYVCSMLTWSGCDKNDGIAPDKKAHDKENPNSGAVVKKDNDIQVYVHFMPWFETDVSNNGKWGYHWTMKNCNPNIVDAKGRRQIAAHYYPQTGPYASGDENMLYYQLLLMKYSGIDGVMVDWYGVQSDNTVAKHKSNTEVLAKVVAAVGLKMAIVYEDSPLASAADKVGQARQDMRYLSQTFVNKSYYVRVDNKPLLLVFGPQQLLKAKDWYRTFSVLSTKPMFLCLNGHSERVNSVEYTNAEGEFTWVNPTPDYSVVKRFKMYVAGAMPGFHDFYKEGGAGEGYATYDAENGELFKRQLNAAKQANMKWLQISTWNDYGEGTTIEPTLEYGYKYLVELQKFTGVSYNQDQLELVHRWYQLKVKHPNDARVKEALQALLSLQPDKASKIMNDSF